MWKLSLTLGHFLPVLVLLHVAVGSITATLLEKQLRQERSANAKIGATEETAFSAEKPSTRVLLQMLFRHGDRSPIDFFPWDSHKAFWTQGAGQLTQLGMRQAYDYGKELRQRYADFLSKTYNRSQVMVRSTDYDRTLMSAQCLLAGLYPAGMTDWAPSLWQPIPIHTQPEVDDHLFGRSRCPKLHVLANQFKDSKLTAQLLDKYKSLFEELRTNTGSEVNLEIAHQISDTMYCEGQHNLSRPDWMSDAMFERIMSLRDGLMTLEFKAAGSARLGGGPLLAEMIHNMEERVKDPSSGKKLFLFSAHDTNIANLARAMGFFNDLHPPYMTSLSLELLQQDGFFYVRTLFNNHTAHSPYVIPVMGCADTCPLSQFHRLLKHSMLPAAQRTEACKLTTSHTGFAKNGVPILVGALMVLFVLVAFLVYRLKRRQGAQASHAPHVQYRHLLTDDDSDDDQDIQRIDDV